MPNKPIDRRTFLGRAVGAGTTAAAVSELRRPSGAARVARIVTHFLAPSDSILDHPAAECPIDTIVIVMMENRSFDHFLGWLGDDSQYLETGRRRHGRDFSVNARVRQTFVDPSGTRVPTRSAGSLEPKKLETRGCTFSDPGHSWDLARVQRDRGFLAAGSDVYAITYYRAEGLPFYEALVRRFTVFDRWHSSLLGPTFPNRQYFLSAQSEGTQGQWHWHAGRSVPRRDHCRSLGGSRGTGRLLLHERPAIGALAPRANGTVHPSAGPVLRGCVDGKLAPCGLRRTPFRCR
jgi:phospholipase C